MSAVYHSVRVPVSSWADDAAFEELLALLGEYRDCVQQIAFFSSEFHPPLPLAVAEERFTLLRDRIARAKAAGFSCGVNILATVGHHPERMDEALHGSWRRMTNIDGETCKASFCPADEEYQRDYVGPLYTLCCGAKPDFIWVDDDVRYGHIPIGNGCFCDGCLALFNREYHYDFDRPRLKAALSDIDNMTLRHDWLRHQSEKIAGLLGFIRRTVNACDDTITLGFMTGERPFEGYDFPLWAEALSDHGKYPVMWRPGGGAYTDRPFAGQVEKSAQIGRQCAGLPDYVTVIQSEIENFPYRLLQKSHRATALESLLHVGTGCTGAAFNILPSTREGESVAIMRGHFEAIRATFPFAKLLSDTLGRAPSVGVFDGWHRHTQAAADDFFRGWGDFTGAWQHLYELGLPHCFDFDFACCYLLTGSQSRAFSDEELKTILSSGVYLDAEALRVLNERGFAELTGFRVSERFPEDHVEVYADHPLNEGFVGKRRLCPQVFVRGSSAALVPHPAAERLCYLTDYHGHIAADCSLGLFTNALGGRVCVSSHYAAADMGDTFKAAQIKRIFRTMSGDRLPFVAESCARLHVVARRTPQGNAVVLLNPTMDRLTEIPVLLAGRYHTLKMTGEDMRQIILPAAGTDGAMTRFLLPELPPFSMALLCPGD